MMDKRPPRVAVFGEVILDLIAGSDSRYTAHLGGSPYNVALGLARQQVPVSLLSPLSRDPVGDRFASSLEQAGGRLGSPRSDRPTSVALVWVGPDGQPDYALHRGDIADLDISSNDLCQRTPPGVELVHTGALTLTPAAVGLVRPWMQHLFDLGLMVSIDINFRPRASRHLDRYVAAVESVLPLCDLVKLSDEDLRGMGRTGTLESEARRLLNHLPATTGLAVVTAGARGALLMNRVATVRVEAMNVDRIVDTVGAGDCFQAGLLAAILEYDLLTPDALSRCGADTLRAIALRAQASAALNVEQAGCQPPTLAAIQARIRHDAR